MARWEVLANQMSLALGLVKTLCSILEIKICNSQSEKKGQREKINTGECHQAIDIQA